MQFKVVFEIEDKHIGPIVAILTRDFPISRLQLQSAEVEDILAEMPSVAPVQQVGKKKNQRRFRRSSKLRVEGQQKPTVKDAIWNYVRNAEAPQPVGVIRQKLVARGYNGNSIASQLEALKTDGRLEESGDFRPKRYIAK